MATTTNPLFIKRAFSFLNLIIVNLLIFSSIFLFLEIGARAYSYFKNGRAFFRPDTFISCWITTYDYPPPMIGPNGEYFFRHREIPTFPNKPENTFRIIAVGGSTTVNQDAYLINGVDYSIALEGKLKRNIETRDFEVLNAGADAFSTAHSLINIEFRLVEFRPNLILMMHNINDSTVNYFLKGATWDYSNKYLQSYFLNPSLQGTRSFTGFLTQSRFLAKYGLPQMMANKIGDINPTNDFENGLHIFSRNLLAIAAICEMNGIELVLMSQPNSMEPHRFVSEQTFLAYNDAIAEIAAEHEIGFIDLYTLMGHSREYFVDQVHYTPEGVDRLSEILASELKPIILKSERDDRKTW